MMERQLNNNSCNTQINDRLQILIKGLSKCKIEYLNDKEECKRLKELNMKLEFELKEAKELEKSHRYHLQTLREMICNLQETVSQLVYLKRDIKKLKEELLVKDNATKNIEKDRDMTLQKHSIALNDIRNIHEQQMDKITKINERRIQQIQEDSDTQVAQFTCVIEELRSKMKDMEIEQRDKMNVIVLEYEEKMQREAALVSQLQEQLSRQTSRSDANIEAYRRRLEELEEKLKRNQFKQYLAQNTYSSQYESQVERPYSVDRDNFISKPVNISPVRNATPANKAVKSTGSLQVIYTGNNTTNLPKNCEKKGQLHVTKKRKLYNEKEFQDF